MTKDETNHHQAAYAIVSLNETTKARPMSQATSAQQAELYKLIRAYNLAKGKTANIYIDRRYTFGVAHNFGMLWKQRGFLTSSVQKIKKNSSSVLELLEAPQLHKSLATIKVPGDSMANTEEIEIIIWLTLLLSQQC